MQELLNYASPKIYFEEIELEMEFVNGSVQVGSSDNDGLSLSDFSDGGSDDLGGEFELY